MKIIGYQILKETYSNFIIKEELGVSKIVQQWSDILTKIINDNADKKEIIIDGNKYPELQKELPLDKIIVKIGINSNNIGTVDVFKSKTNDNFIDVNIFINKVIFNIMGALQQTITHELLHAYETYKKPNININNESLYQYILKLLNGSNYDNYYFFIKSIYHAFNDEINATTNELFNYLKGKNVIDLDSFKNGIKSSKIIDTDWIKTDDFNIYYELIKTDKEFNDIITNIGLILKIKDNVKVLDYLKKYLEEQKVRLHKNVNRLYDLFI